jgi:hypothetical protein
MLQLGRGQLAQSFLWLPVCTGENARTTNPAVDRLIDLLGQGGY